MIHLDNKERALRSGPVFAFARKRHSKNLPSISLFTEENLTQSPHIDHSYAAERIFAPAPYDNAAAANFLLHANAQFHTTKAT
jgi:hypothetical protein